MPASPTQPKKRGIIVVDATEFQVLGLPVSPKPQKGRPLHDLNEKPTYLDLLKLLAKEGYEIIIPEMVAYESANILLKTGGGYHYPNSLYNHGQTAHFVYAGQDNVRGFLGEVASGKHGNIEMVHAEGDGAHNRFLKPIRKACERKIEDGQDRKDVRVHRRMAVTAAQHEKHLSGSKEATYKNLGEQHAFEIIQSLIKRDDADTPIFFMSADSDARYELQKLLRNEPTETKNRIGCVTTLGILNALEYHQHHTSTGQVTVLNELGFPGLASDHWGEIQYKCVEQSKLPGYNTDCYNDSRLFHNKEIRGGKPFLRSLAGLAEKLAKEREQAEAEKAALPKGPSPADKFKKKYEKFGGNYFGAHNGANGNGTHAEKITASEEATRGNSPSL